MDELDYFVTSTYNTMLLKDSCTLGKVRHDLLIKEAFKAVEIYAEQRKKFVTKMEKNGE